MHFSASLRNKTLCWRTIRKKHIVVLDAAKISIVSLVIKIVQYIFASNKQGPQPHTRKTKN